MEKSHIVTRDRVRYGSFFMNKDEQGSHYSSSGTGCGVGAIGLLSSSSNAGFA